MFVFVLVFSGHIKKNIHLKNLDECLYGQNVEEALLEPIIFSANILTIFTNIL